MRRLLCALSALLVCLPLAACWDYKGLDTLDIVSGMAIDKDVVTGAYILTIEIIDMHSGDPGTGVSVTYAEARGETIFNAIRNAKNRLTHKLFGGNSMALIISHQIARDEGMLFILEYFMRNGEPRETLSVAISQADTAREILCSRGLNSKIIAYELHDLITEDSRMTAATKSIGMYQVYDRLQAPGSALVLPALRTVDNFGAQTAECNGIALFQGDRLIGFDTPQNTFFYLLVVDEVTGAPYSLPMGDGPWPSFKITESSTKARVSVADGQARITLQIKLILSGTEFQRQLDVMDMDGRRKAEDAISQRLCGQIESYIRRVQTEIGVDIFGLGRGIYQHQPDLWRQLEPQWNQIFQQAQVEVAVTSDLIAFGVIKAY